MALIDTVKPRLGVFYSDATKDAEIQSMIDAALLYFTRAGWDVSTPDALAAEAVILYCKMAQSTDPAQLTNHPVLLSFIAQGRVQPYTCPTPVADPVGGSYAVAQNVALTCADEEAEIRYTLDGTTPNEESDLYESGLAIPAGATTVLKAIALRPSYYNSAVLTATYVIS